MNVSTMFYPVLWHSSYVELPESESRDGDTETYVFEHLMPVKVEDSNNKHWYWMKYIAEEIDFWTCNNAYKELYDRQAFQGTIKKCQCSFGTGISYRFTVRLTYTVVKHKKKGRSGYMKSHKFFAWATVFCFVMTMITGYKRQ